MTSTSNILQERKQRWLDFYNLKKPGTPFFIIHYSNGLETRPWPRPDLQPARLEWAWHKYLLQLEQVEWLDDDSLPYLDIYTGTEVFAQALGCQVAYPDDNMPFALPLIHSAAEVSALKVPHFGDTLLAMLFDIADELRRRAGPQALVKMVDIQSPMDIAALIWEKASFYTAMIETPQAVLELADKVRSLLVPFLDEWFQRYGPEFIAHYPDYYMPRGITLSEDEVGSVSSAMFMDYFLPELVSLSERYGGIGMHCCANARHQWENFKRIPNLRMLNLVQPPEITRQAYEYFADHVAQTHSYGGEGAAWTWPDQYPQEARVLMDVPLKHATMLLRLPINYAPGYKIDI